MRGASERVSFATDAAASGDIAERWRRRVQPRFVSAAWARGIALAPTTGGYAAATGSGRTITVSAIEMISVTGRSALEACSRIASGLDAS